MPASSHAIDGWAAASASGMPPPASRSAGGRRHGAGRAEERHAQDGRRDDNGATDHFKLQPRYGHTCRTVQAGSEPVEPYESFLIKDDKAAPWPPRMRTGRAGRNAMGTPGRSDPRPEE